MAFKGLLLTGIFVPLALGNDHVMTTRDLPKKCIPQYLAARSQYASEPIDSTVVLCATRLRRNKPWTNTPGGSEFDRVVTIDGSEDSDSAKWQQIKTIMEPIREYGVEMNPRDMKANYPLDVKMPGVPVDKGKLLDFKQDPEKPRAKVIRKDGIYTGEVFPLKVGIALADGVPRSQHSQTTIENHPKGFIHYADHKDSSLSVGERMKAWDERNPTVIDVEQYRKKVEEMNGEPKKMYSQGKDQPDKEIDFHIDLLVQRNYDTDELVRLWENPKFLKFGGHSPVNPWSPDPAARLYKQCYPTHIIIPSFSNDVKEYMPNLVEDMENGLAFVQATSCQFYVEDDLHFLSNLAWVMNRMIHLNGQRNPWAVPLVNLFEQNHRVDAETRLMAAHLRRYLQFSRMNIDYDVVNKQLESHFSMEAVSPPPAMPLTTKIVGLIGTSFVATILLRIAVTQKIPEGCLVLGYFFICLPGACRDVALWPCHAVMTFIMKAIWTPVRSLIRRRRRAKQKTYLPI